MMNKLIKTLAPVVLGGVMATAMTAQAQTISHATGYLPIPLTCLPRPWKRSLAAS